MRQVRLRRQLFDASMAMAVPIILYNASGLRKGSVRSRALRDHARVLSDHNAVFFSMRYGAVGREQAAVEKLARLSKQQERGWKGWY